MNPETENFEELFKEETPRKKSPIKIIFLVILLGALIFSGYEIVIHREWLKITIGMTLFITFLLGSWAIIRFLPDAGSGVLKRFLTMVLISLLFSGLMAVWKVADKKITPPQNEKTIPEKTFEEQMDDVGKMQDILKDYLPESEDPLKGL